ELNKKGYSIMLPIDMDEEKDDTFLAYKAEQILFLRADKQRKIRTGHIQNFKTLFKDSLNFDDFHFLNWERIGKHRVMINLMSPDSLEYLLSENTSKNWVLKKNKLTKP
ncbi:MAG: hypothetical protein AAF696_39070, partial [Bacteroidota bacterium]